MAATRIKHPADDSMFGLKFELEGPIKNPSGYFGSIEQFITCFEVLDEDLLISVEPKLRGEIVLESIEVSSLLVWLRNVLQEVDDDALKTLDWRPLIGRFLVKAKHAVVARLNELIEQERIEALDDAAGDVEKIAEDEGIHRVLMYKPISRRSMARTLIAIASARQDMGQNAIEYVFSGRSTPILIPGNLEKIGIENLLTIETRTVQDQSMVLRVKKPDYLGNSKWAFHYQNRIIWAKMLDHEWISKFHSKVVNVRPGDALKCSVDVVQKFDENGLVLTEIFEVRKVFEVVPDYTEVLYLPLRP